MNQRVCDLELEILSPCFMGGAYQQPEFRIASIRGIWRYWYRALYGRGDEREPLTKEIELFGNTDGRGRARLIPADSTRMLEAAEWRRSGQSGADYLLFTMDMNRRSYLKPGPRVPLRLHVCGEDSDSETAMRSLAVALSFSGIGARARRMAGAVHLASKAPLDNDVFFQTPAADPRALGERLHRLLKPALSRSLPNPRYPVVCRGSFSAGVLQKPYRTWREALDEVGASFRDFRVRRQPDYGVAKAAMSPGRHESGGTITRAAFGLPIKFRFRSEQGRGPMVTHPGSDRRGSPFFITLEHLADDRLAVVWCLFRTALTPSGRVLVGGIEVPAPGYELVEEMLNQAPWTSPNRITE